MPPDDKTTTQSTSTTSLRAYTSEARALWILIWPMLIAQLAQMGTGVVDTIMAGRYSAVDLAAVAIGYNVWLPVYLFIVGMMLATTSQLCDIHRQTSPL